MNRSAAFLTLALFLGGAVIFGATFADEASPAPGKETGGAELAKQLRAMLVAQTEAKQKEDLAGTIENVDARLIVKYGTQFGQIFKTYKIEYSLDDFKLLYHDDEIAVTRVKQTLKKVEGPDFKDNERDALQIFRKRDGKWKIYEQVILDRTFLNAAPKPAPATQPKEQPDTKPGKED
ncbi:MAG: hypothetical protein O7D91_09270 [Planctomycetota bacterium]|nr:hypothetical protein [Planctomycetota bacterium]